MPRHCSRKTPSSAVTTRSCPLPSIPWGQHVGGDAVSFPQIRQAYADSRRWQIHPEKGICTYWNFSYHGDYDRSSGLRMDLLGSPSISNRLRGAGVDVAVRGWEKPSDHAPAWIELI